MSCDVVLGRVAYSCDAYVYMFGVPCPIIPKMSAEPAKSKSQRQGDGSRPSHPLTQPIAYTFVFCIGSTHPPIHIGAPTTSVWIAYPWGVHRRPLEYPLELPQIVFE